MDARELDELERLAKAATPGPYVYNGHPFMLAGPDAEYAIALANAAPRLIAAARRQGASPPESEPLDVERLARAMHAVWPGHPEGTGGTGGNAEAMLMWRVLDPAIYSDYLVKAIAAEYAHLSKPAQPETER